MSANPRAWNTPMRLAESTDTVVEYRLRAAWRLVLLVVGALAFVPMVVYTLRNGGSSDVLPGPLAALLPVALLATFTGLFASVGLGMAAVARRVERRTTGDVVVDVEEPALGRGRSRTTHGTVRLRRLDLARRDVRQVVVERVPGASVGGTGRDRYRVAIDLADGRSVHPWWSFARGATGEAFMRDAAARMHAVMRLEGEVAERDTVRISTYDAAAYALGGAAAASIEAQWTDQLDPLNPVHTLARRTLAITIDTAICLGALIGIGWLMRMRPDLILLTALPLYGLLRLGYHTIWEGAAGTTLGKRVARLRVVAVEGGPVGFRRAFKRNLARLVDAVAFYLVALVVAAQPGQQRSQRIGDRWAGTIVVDEGRVEETLAARRARA